MANNGLEQTLWAAADKLRGLCWLMVRYRPGRAGRGYPVGAGEGRVGGLYGGAAAAVVFQYPDSGLFVVIEIRYQQP